MEGALQHVIDSMFQEASGMRMRTKGVPRVLVIVTDGDATRYNSYNKLSELKASGDESVYDGINDKVLSSERCGTVVVVIAPAAPSLTVPSQ